MAVPQQGIDPVLAAGEFVPLTDGLLMGEPFLVRLRKVLFAFVFVLDALSLSLEVCPVFPIACLHTGVVIALYHGNDRSFVWDLSKP